MENKINYKTLNVLYLNFYFRPPVYCAIFFNCNYIYELLNELWYLNFINVSNLLYLQRVSSFFIIRWLSTYPDHVQMIGTINIFIAS